MSCERDWDRDRDRDRNRNCGCDGNRVGGSRRFPCREQLRNLERCLQNIEDRPSRPRHCHCRCCCCCCHQNGRGRGNQTTWGREY